MKMITILFSGMMKMMIFVQMMMMIKNQFMTREERNEKNKLICEFLGAEVYVTWEIQGRKEYAVQGPEVIKWRQQLEVPGFRSIIGGVNEKMLLVNCRFDQFWDWLMLAVEAIEALPTDPHDGNYGVHIVSNTCTIQGTLLHLAIRDLDGYGPVYLSDVNAVFPTKLESTYYNVVEFIKWHNKQKGL